VRAVWWVLVVSLALAQALPGPAWSQASLGTARGLGAAELSYDGGRTWISLAESSYPVLPGSRITTRAGSATVDLVDGGQLEILPLSTVLISTAGAFIQAELSCGRLAFGLPRPPRLVILTPQARIEPLSAPPLTGEVFSGVRELGISGVTGVKMSQGVVRVVELVGQRRSLEAGADPVFVPGRPNISAPLFLSDVRSAPPGGVRAVFDERGRNLGAQTADGHVVIQPGFAPDLAGPISPRAVDAGRARVPEADRTPGVTLLFDAHEDPVGYLGSADCSPLIAFAGFPVTAAVTGAAVLGGVLGGVFIHRASSSSSAPAEATPFRPAP